MVLQMGWLSEVTGELLIQIPGLWDSGDSDLVSLESQTTFFFFHTDIISPNFLLHCNPVWGNTFQCYRLLTDI